MTPTSTPRTRATPRRLRERRTATSRPAGPTIAFPPFLFDPESGALWSGRRRKSLRPKAAALLRYLIDRAGEVVTREELFAELWPSVRVGAGVLKVYVWEIRQALSDRRGVPRYIETVPRRGYRWIAPLDTAPPPRAPREASGSTARSGKALLVGRRPALTALAQHLERARVGERRICFVRGEAGIGKTAVVDGFLRRVATRPELCIAQGQCIPQYGAGEPYLPILSALGQLGEGPARRALVRVLRRYAPTWLLQLPSLWDAADLETVRRDSAGANRERMLRELAEALERLAARRTLVLVLEDLHWSDASTLDLLAFLGRRAGRARLLILGTDRTDEPGGSALDAVAPELLLRSCSVELRLPFLEEADVARYLRRRLGVAAGEAAELARAVHQRTEGNPLFMVSIVDDLLAGAPGDPLPSVGLAAAQVRRTVPPSLREAIERRIERLDPSDQRLLETASAAGAEFSAAVAAAALDAAIEDVETRCTRLDRNAQLVRSVASEEWPDGTTSGRYAFVHGLYRSVLYDRLTPARRQRLHRRIADRLERGYGSRASEIAAELASHFERGREPERAVQALQLAAENALSKHANPEAAAHLRKALDLLRTLPASRERSRRELGLLVRLGAPLLMTRGYAAPEVVETYRRALELSRQTGDGPELLLALVGLYRFSLVRSELRTAKRLGEQTLRLAASAHLPIASLAARLMLGLAVFSLGDLDAAKTHFEQGLLLHDPEQQGPIAQAFGDDPAVSCLAELAMTLWFLGYPDQALQRAREALACARKVGIPYSMTFALNYLVWARLLRREGALGREPADQAVRLATENGFQHWVAQGTAIRGWVLAEMGEIEAGIAQLREGLAVYAAIGAEVIRPWHLGRLAEAHAQLGRVDEARATIDEALASMKQREERFYEAELHRLSGELLLGRPGGRTGSRSAPRRAKDGRAADAERCFTRAIEISQRQGARSLELRAAMSLARLWSEQGQPGRGRRRLAEVLATFDEGFDTGDLRRASDWATRGA